MDIKDSVRKYALANAVKFGGKAGAGSVIGPMLSENPELKKDMKSLKETVDSVISEVNSMKPEEQKAELAKFGNIQKEKKEEKKELTLPNAAKGKVVMRFAPNPNGPIHIGHARTVLLNWLLCEKHSGKFILRFDDTDPGKKIPMKEAYAMIREDLEWLGVRIGEEARASDRLPIYYDYCERLIRKGGAYVCLCGAEDWKKLRDKKKACQCRERSIDESLKLWKKMLSHELKEGQAVVRVKTDIAHKDPALRDWPAFRIIDAPKHTNPEANRFHVWPLLNFASAIDDRLFGVTHIIRGVDLEKSGQRQKFLYNHFGWEYPEVILNGKMVLKGVTISTSETKKRLSAGELSGWDDPRLYTIRALRRRGFTAEGIRNFIESIGMGKKNALVAPENLDSFNRKILDAKADRLFAVINPVEINNPCPGTVEVKNHPDRDDTRKVKAGKKLFVSHSDFDKFKGKEVRLLNLCNIRLDKNPKVVGGEPHQKLQWVSDGAVPVSIAMPDGSVSEGLAEPAAAKRKEGDVAQFARIGFCRLDDKKKMSFFFAHK